MMSRMRAALAAAFVLAPAAARADFHIFSPTEIDYGELELEHNGDAVFDRRPDQRGAASYTTEIGTGLTPWWHSEIEFAFNRAPGDNQSTLETAAPGGAISWLARPTPITEPIRACDDELGMPSHQVPRFQTIAASSRAKIIA